MGFDSSTNRRAPPAGRFSTESELDLAGTPVYAIIPGAVVKLPSRVIAAVLVACMGCASASRPEDIQSQILQLDAEWSRAAQARDIDRVISFWADDAIVLPPGNAPVVGKSAIREFVVKSFQTPGFTISWKTTEMAVSRSGDMAYGTGTNRVTFTGSDGRQVTVDGKAVTVWRRGKEGAWKCVVDIWNDVTSPSR